MIVVFMELYPFIPLSVVLTLFQGYSGVKELKLKVVYFVSYPFKLRLSISVKYMI